MSLEDRARKGHVEGLVELRDMLARQLDECDSKRDFAALTRAFLDVVARLEAAGVEESGGVLDDLKKRREARGA